MNDPNLTNNVDVDTDGVNFDPQGTATSVEVEITALVRQPTTWTAPPTHLRVRGYTRRYTLEPADSPRPLHQDPVSPIPWYDRDVPLTSQVCVGPWGPGYVCSVVVDIPAPQLTTDYLARSEQRTTANSLLYFELTPVQHGELGAVLSAPQTFCVGAVSSAFLTQLICIREPDETSAD